MNFWQRWKEKHWDEKVSENDPSSSVVFFGIRRPPLRQAARWFAKLWEEQPLNVVMAVAAVVASAAAVIALLR
ncbi:hypothetical protein QRO08_15920 [Paracidovorax citrulli]|uniref:Uncharacterized protein n=1 Tax=Paracidovorax citrulli TaxID=80869 RepID=A0ABY9AKV2_PARCI|nr:hypothetical protein [Paracidovorax citrulli]ATG94641.1 hypothetical protein CQB05_11905 [Paracidovorax citrulli]MVT38626.1 hypothetical protein [Paracidovorax citrulli]UMT83989.1 hypothetical protein FRC75_11775 [Paracidovorax citrulli]WIY32352.1 hypothetical protein QRO09_11795 [Paracidovorax citrulli]WIY41629.1 hypothetical protein QRO10_12070 [Paracidovorax citrulli]